MKYLTLISFLLCSGCTQPLTESICPAIIPYSAEEQNGLSKELYEHPELKYAPLFLEGYAQTRAALRPLSKNKNGAKA